MGVTLGIMEKKMETTIIMGYIGDYGVYKPQSPQTLQLFACSLGILKNIKSRALDPTRLCLRYREYATSDVGAGGGCLIPGRKDDLNPEPLARIPLCHFRFSDRAARARTESFELASQFATGI